MTVRHQFAAATLVIAVLLAGCTGGAPTATRTTRTPEPKDSAMQVRKQADVEQQAKSFADALATEVGNPLEQWKTQPAPCESTGGADATSGPWTLSGFATIAVKPADQVATLTRLRDQWQRRGYQITEFRTIPPDNKLGTLSARVPTEDLTVSMESTTPGTALSVIVASGCYAPAPGENPGG